MICAPCCGTYREVTIDCVETCPHLLASRRHDRPPAAPEAPPIAPEIEISERFLHSRRGLLVALNLAIGDYRAKHPGIVDADLRAALEGLVRTLATRRAGILYESRPLGEFAAGLFEALLAAWGQYQEDARRELLPEAPRESDFERAAVLLARMAQAHGNGRPRSRRALSFLAPPELMRAAGRAAEPAPLLITP